MPVEIESYKDLVVWQKAMDLAVASYGLTRAWPKEELYGLTSQIRRAATSIPANIAEGYGRDNLVSYQQFLRIAQGSLKELETHLLISVRVGIASPETIDPLMARSDSVGRTLRSLIRKLSTD